VEGVSLAFDDKCDPLGLPLMTSLGIVGLVLSKYFQWYWWCHDWSFDVSPRSISPFLSLFFLSGPFNNFLY